MAALKHAGSQLTYATALGKDGLNMNTAPFAYFGLIAASFCGMWIAYRTSIRIIEERCADKHGEIRHLIVVTAIAGIGFLVTVGFAILSAYAIVRLSPLFAEEVRTGQAAMIAACLFGLAAGHFLNRRLCQWRRRWEVKD